jgi:hypothetical protein
MDPQSGSTIVDLTVRLRCIDVAHGSVTAFASSAMLNQFSRNTNDAQHIE